jgi:hypothetical protein
LRIGLKIDETFNACEASLRKMSGLGIVLQQTITLPAAQRLTHHRHPRIAMFYISFDDRKTLY